jgi:hypothetical protein
MRLFAAYVERTFAYLVTIAGLGVAFFIAMRFFA